MLSFKRQIYIICLFNSVATFLLPEIHFLNFVNYYEFLPQIEKKFNCVTVLEKEATKNLIFGIKTYTKTSDPQLQDK